MEPLKQHQDIFAGLYYSCKEIRRCYSNYLCSFAEQAAINLCKNVWNARKHQANAKPNIYYVQLGTGSLYSHERSISRSWNKRMFFPFFTKYAQKASCHGLPKMILSLAFVPLPHTETYIDAFSADITEELVGLLNWLADNCIAMPFVTLITCIIGLWEYRIPRLRILQVHEYCQ